MYLYLICITRRRSLEWIKSNVWLHCWSFISCRRFFRSKNEMIQLAGIQKRAVITTTVTRIMALWRQSINFKFVDSTYWRCCRAGSVAPCWCWSPRLCPKIVQPHPGSSFRTSPLIQRKLVSYNWKSWVAWSCAYFVTETLNARRSVWQNVRWLYRKACLVNAHSATSNMKYIKCKMKYIFLIFDVFLQKNLQRVGAYHN